MFTSVNLWSFFWMYFASILWVLVFANLAPDVPYPASMRSQHKGPAFMQHSLWL